MLIVQSLNTAIGMNNFLFITVSQMLFVTVSKVHSRFCFSKIHFRKKLFADAGSAKDTSHLGCKVLRIMLWEIQFAKIH